MGGGQTYAHSSIVDARGRVSLTPLSASFATARSVTRSNSRTLSVTSVAPRLNACAAISKLLVPMVSRAVQSLHECAGVKEDGPHWASRFSA